jgi:O-antigen/teichoic acid export membrane protein
VKVEKTIEFLRMVLVFLSVVAIRQFWFLSLFTLWIAWIIWLFVSTLCSVLWFKKYYYMTFLSWTHHIEKEDVKKWYAYSIWSLLAANAWTIIAQVDMQLILLYMWKESAWFWSNYMSLNSAASFIFVPLLSFLFPVFTEYVEKWLVGRIRYMRKRIFILTALYAIAVWVVCSMFGEEISMLLFGDAYQLSWEILAASAWLLVTPILGIMNFQLLRSIGSVKQATILQWIVVCIHVLASYIVVQEYNSLIYMSYVFLGSYLLFFLLSQFYIYRVWYEKKSSQDYLV